MNLSKKVYTHKLKILYEGEEINKLLTTDSAKFIAKQLKNEARTITIELSSPFRIITVFKDKITLEEIGKEETNINNYIFSLNLDRKTLEKLQDDLLIRKKKRQKISKKIIDNMLNFYKKGDNLMSLEEIKDIYLKKGMKKEKADLLFKIKKCTK